MHSLRKRHSWPALQAKKSHARTSPSIDQDPFAYFVSSALDEESVLQSHFRAGIPTRRRSHSLPSFRATSKRHGQTATDKARKRVTKLKKWIERMQVAYLHHSPPGPVTVSPPPVSPTTLDEFLDMGRGRDIRSTATSRVRAKTRTPPRKPRAWKQPSDNIWPLVEEAEEIGLGIKGQDTDHLFGKP